MDDKFLFVLVGFCVIVIGFAVYYDVKNNNQELFQQQCEDKGGVYLHRTYTMGKNATGHKYTCVRKEAVID